LAQRPTRHCCLVVRPRGIAASWFAHAAERRGLEGERAVVGQIQRKRLHGARVVAREELSAALADGPAQVAVHHDGACAISIFVEKTTRHFLQGGIAISFGSPTAKQTWGSSRRLSFSPASLRSPQPMTRGRTRASQPPTPPIFCLSSETRPARYAYALDISLLEYGGVGIRCGTAARLS